jgi:hypothetical protein
VNREVKVLTRSRWRWAVLLALMGLVIAACGGGDGAEGEGEGGDTTVPEEARTVIRFAFAPDPVWDYMNDTGMIVEWEDEFNTRVVTSSTWDEFTFFAGGHGDVVSIGTQEVPVLEQETEIKTVTFGRYNYQRSPMIRRAGDPYEELPDVEAGAPICVSSPVSNTQFWSVAMNELHDIAYFVGGGDYELIVNDHFVNPQNLLNGDCEVAVIIPEAAAPYLRTGELELMYGGQMPFQLYNTFSGFDDGENHVMSNLFSSTEEFYDANPEAAAAFLVLWQRGIDAWSDPAIQEEIIATYPQHFAVESDEDIAFIQEFMSGENDWFVEDVYLTEDWIEAEKAIWDFMVDLDEGNQNKLNPDFPDPRFEVIEPPA